LPGGFSISGLGPWQTNSSQTHTISLTKFLIVWVMGSDLMTYYLDVGRSNSIQARPHCHSAKSSHEDI